MAAYDIIMAILLLFVHISVVAVDNGRDATLPLVRHGVRAQLAVISTSVDGSSRRDNNAFGQRVGPRPKFTDTINL